MSIVQNGSVFTIEPITATYNKLPQGNYLLSFNNAAGRYELHKKEDFTLPSKIYGDMSIVQRWLHSWKHNSTKNMGILLSGMKGSGKTITAQKFCIDSKLPVIIVSDAYGGGHERAFINFLSDPDLGECIVFIDEFEKVFDSHNEQSTLLSLMDGNFYTRLIFLLTVNDNHINDFLINRLNRIKYRKSYEDLTYEEIDEVIDDCLDNKEHRASIHEFFDKINIRTLDLVINLIKEMNLFKEDAIKCGATLNLKMSPKTYEVHEIYKGQEYSCYNTDFQFDNDVIHFYRKSINYLSLPKKDDNDIVAVRSARHYDDYGNPLPTASDNYSSYEICINVEDCNIVKNQTTMIVTHKSGLKFRLKELTKNDLVF